MSNAAHDRNTTAMKLIPAKVTLDCYEGPPFNCFLQDPPVDWNGWECPYFSKEQAIAMLEGTESMTSGPWRYDEALDAFIVTNGDTNEDDIFDGQDTEHGRLYAIGAWFWCWSKVD